ncbi:MAG: hypothetical protein K0Q92_1737, partial [Steroidobacteraceae bacterium]|nr:hypothetical protein [Steroidobacteraceae bacterium]
RLELYEIYVVVLWAVVLAGAAVLRARPHVAGQAAS